MRSLRSAWAATAAVRADSQVSMSSASVLITIPPEDSAADCGDVGAVAVQLEPLAAGLDDDLA